MHLTTDPRPERYVSAGRPLYPRGAIAAVAISLLVIFILDRQIDAAPVQHLYYLPIILAASRLRWAGGVAASLLAVGLYHLANPALLAFAYHESDFVQIVLFIAVGLVTARLTDNARRLHQMAMTDDLTGLHNLRSFEQHLTAMIRAAAQSGGSLWMLVLDLDRLKSLNDTYGHLTGAEAVRHVGQILASHLPADAVACRYGGDEFAVSLAGRTGEDVHAMATDLCRAVYASAPVLAGRPFPAGTLSISVGVARRPAGAERTAAETDAHVGETLFRTADSALYGAKSRGRNQVCVAPGPAPRGRAAHQAT